jgi:hypothetical protein
MILDALNLDLEPQPKILNPAPHRLGSGCGSYIYYYIIII